MTDFNAVADGIGNMRQIGYKDMTVAELVSKLSGLPPMMEVYADADGTSMFINDATVEEQTTELPRFLRIKCSVHPQTNTVMPMNKAEAEAMQRQRSMELSHNIEQASKMPQGVLSR